MQGNCSANTGLIAVYLLIAVDLEYVHQIYFNSRHGTFVFWYSEANSLPSRPGGAHWRSFASGCPFANLEVYFN